MRTRPALTWLVGAGGLGLLLLMPQLNRAADTSNGRPATVSFSDIIERQLPAPEFVVPQQVLLNLDNGELLSMPTNVWIAGLGFNPRPHYDWMAKHRADLLVHSSEVSTNLNFHLDDGRLAILGTNLTFETITAWEVSRELKRSVFQHLMVPRPDSGPGVALVFRTRERGSGVMQLMGFSGKPQPILTLRYKLVQPAAASKIGEIGVRTEHEREIR